MKVAINKYLYLIIALLLNTFVGIYANDITGSIENNTIGSGLKGLYYSTENSFNQNKTTSAFTLHNKNRQHRLLFDCIEINEIEVEESTSSKRDTNNYENITFTSNAQAFKNFSEELQKHKQYISCILGKPTTRLHVLFQVFII